MKVVRRFCKGQVLPEYVIMLVICLVIALALAGLFHFFTRYGEDRVEWVSIDYP